LELLASLIVHFWSSVNHMLVLLLWLVTTMKIMMNMTTETSTNDAKQLSCHFFRFWFILWKTTAPFIEFCSFCCLV